MGAVLCVRRYVWYVGLCVGVTRNCEHPCFLTGMQQLNIVHAPLCGSLWEIQCLMVEAAEQVPFQINRGQTPKTRDPDGGSFHIWMRSLQGTTTPPKYAMQLDIRLYINQLPVNERLRMTATLLPIMSLLTEQWDHIAVTVLNCSIDKSFPHYWFIVQAFADASLRKHPLSLPSNTEWRGKYLFNTVAWLLCKRLCGCNGHLW